MHAIAGAGFGLYGYLPAIAGGRGGTVVLPESSRARLAARPELARFLPAVRWAPDLDAAFAQARVAVIAVPPAEQPALVERCLRHPGLEALVLEKPVAATPEEAREVLESIARAGRRCRVGYTLLETDWAKAICAEPSDEPWSIEWSFLAHHLAKGVDTWKRHHDRGGGALRFYGIHLVALLAGMGYREAIHSSIEGAEPGHPDRWRATLSGPGVGNCTVSVDSRAPTTAFRITRGAAGARSPRVHLADPFDAPPAPGGIDRRVAILERLLANLEEPDAPHHALQAEAQRLWERIEAVTAAGAR